LSRRGLNPIKLAYSPSPPDNGLGQYVSSPGNRAYCYAELAELIYMGMGKMLTCRLVVLCTGNL